MDCARGFVADDEAGRGVDEFPDAAVMPEVDLKCFRELVTQKPMVR